MPDPVVLLREDSMPVPDWLAAYTPGTLFPREDFFASRTVYYPGSATDGHPLILFGKSHAAHCFVFVDYQKSKQQVTEQIRNDRHSGHPTGYQLVHFADLPEHELTPNGWERHWSVVSTHLERQRIDPMVPEGGPFAVWAVLERSAELGDEHGPSRICILHIGGDGIATFDAFYCQKPHYSPYAIVLQDHGRGGNWTVFGGAQSPLWELAKISGLPTWLLVGENTEAWPEYRPISDSSPGGCHRHPRRLYQR